MEIKEEILKYNASRDPKERIRSVEGIIKKLEKVKRQHMEDKTEPDLDEEYLVWNAVNRYYPKKRRPAGARGITLFLSHANGFSKEVSILSQLKIILCELTASLDMGALLASDCTSHPWNERFIH